jgi:hypothetical protein
LIFLLAPFAADQISRRIFMNEIKTLEEIYPPVHWLHAEWRNPGALQKVIRCGQFRKVLVEATFCGRSRRMRMIFYYF